VSRCHIINVQGGSNMTGTDLCVNKPNQSRSYLNHLVCCCHQDRRLWIGRMAYHPNTGFHYCKFLSYLLYDYGSFSNISGMDL